MHKDRDGLMQPPMYENRLALATMERDRLIHPPMHKNWLALATRRLMQPQLALATMRLMQPLLVVLPSRGCSTGLSICMPVARPLRNTKKCWEHMRRTWGQIAMEDDDYTTTTTMEVFGCADMADNGKQ